MCNNCKHRLLCYASWFYAIIIIISDGGVGVLYYWPITGFCKDTYKLKFDKYFTYP